MLNMLNKYQTANAVWYLYIHICLPGNCSIFPLYPIKSPLTFLIRSNRFIIKIWSCGPLKNIFIIITYIISCSRTKPLKHNLSLTRTPILYCCKKQIQLKRSFYWPPFKLFSTISLNVVFWKKQIWYCFHHNVSFCYQTRYMKTIEDRGCSFYWWSNVDGWQLLSLLGPTFLSDDVNLRNCFS